MKLLSALKFERRQVTPEAAAERIRLVALDVDGVLTDGRIGYGCGSEHEIKFFDVKDGSGVTMLRRAGVQVGIISGRKSVTNARRAQELKMDFLVEQCWNKLEGLEQVAAERTLSLEECLYIGDDLIDGETLAGAGVGVAVADAMPEVLSAADFQTEAPGGRGAVREVANWLLRLQGKWPAAVRHYQKRGDAVWRPDLE